MEHHTNLAILAGGGPAPGINSVIGAATIRARLEGCEVIGIREEVLTHEEMAFMMSEISGPERWQRYEEGGDLDFAYEMDEHSRFRCNFLKQAQIVK